jgi:hypothetical protein
MQNDNYDNEDTEHVVMTKKWMKEIMASQGICIYTGPEQKKSEDIPLTDRGGL